MDYEKNIKIIKDKKIIFYDKLIFCVDKYCYIKDIFIYDAYCSIFISNKNTLKHYQYDLYHQKQNYIFNKSGTLLCYHTIYNSDYNYQNFVIENNKFYLNGHIYDNDFNNITFNSFFNKERLMPADIKMIF